MNDDLKLIRKIYDAACEAQPWEDSLRYLMRGFDASAGWLFANIPPDDPSGFSVHIGLPPDTAAVYLREVNEVDLWYHAMLRTHGQLKNGFTYVTDHLLPDKELHRSRFYADFLNPMEIERTVGTVVHDGTDGAPIVGLNVYRPKGRAPFERHDIERMQVLQHHFRQAWFIRRKLGRAELADLTLDLLDSPALLLGQARRILIANTAAERLFAEVPSLVSGGRLCGATPALTQKLELLLRGWSLRGQPVSTFVRLGGSPGQGIVARVLPPPARVTRQVAGVAIAFLAREGHTPVSLMQEAARLYGLSKAESMLVEALASGMTMEEFCARRSLTVATAKTQLQSIFGKTGVRRQADLLRLLWSITA